MSAAQATLSPHADAAREMLRHTLATVAYRGGKALRDAPENFSTYTCGCGCRAPGQVLAHLCDLLDWALSIAAGEQKWSDSKPQSWADDSARFYKALAQFDEYLASDKPLHAPVERLFQGPVADALTHVGQIAMMRRLAGAPLKGENYFVAEIHAGTVGPEQAAPKREF
jgi:hypothetical protein